MRLKNKMNTPICDFVRDYSQSKTMRLHMPGHKGEALLGMESMDITEIAGADSLYEASGIIAQSEANASALFGCKTFYSTEGSSQCIRAVLHLVRLHALRLGRKPIVAAGRNAHKTFLTAAALLDMDVQWLYPRAGGSYLSCNISADELDAHLSSAVEKPAAVYITSPDYLGNTVDIASLAELCHKHGVLLAVDNAHGAYLKFLHKSLHPIDLGADICCDSAHKTLPALTGAAYLHLSEEMDRELGAQVKNAMMLFGSTSPSYLILQSLDAVNLYLESYPQRLGEFAAKVQELKGALLEYGYCLYGNEPMKLSIEAKPYGYTGTQLAGYVRRHNIEPEFADEDYLVLMLSPEISEAALDELRDVFFSLPRRDAIAACTPEFIPAQRAMSVRKALLSDYEVLPVEQCLGRILAVPTVGCPPAVPILVCGEIIDEQAISCFSYYGIRDCCVVK